MLTKIAMIESFANENKLESQLTSRIIREHERKLVDGYLSDDEKSYILEELPMFVKILVAQNMFNGEVKNNIFFRGKDDVFLASILTHMVSHEFQKGEVIYSKGDYPTHIYLVIKGRINFITGKHDTCFKTVTPNSYFGELEVFSKELRKYTARAESDQTQLLLLSRNVFLDTLKKVPEYELDYIKIGMERDLRNQLSLQRVRKLLQLNKTSLFWDEKPKAKKVFVKKGASKIFPWNFEAERLSSKAQSAIKGSIPKKIIKKMSTIVEKSEKDEINCSVLKQEDSILSSDELDLVKATRRVSAYKMRTVLMTNPEITYNRPKRTSLLGRCLSLNLDQKKREEEKIEIRESKIQENSNESSESSSSNSSFEASQSLKGGNLKTHGLKKSMKSFAEDEKNEMENSMNADGNFKATRSLLELVEEKDRKIQKLKKKIKKVKKDNKILAGMLDKFIKKTDLLLLKSSVNKTASNSPFLNLKSRSKRNSEELVSGAFTSKIEGRKKLLFEMFKPPPMKTKFLGEIDEDDDFIRDFETINNSKPPPQDQKEFTTFTKLKETPNLYLDKRAVHSLKKKPQDGSEQLFVDSVKYFKQPKKQPKEKTLEEAKKEKSNEDPDSFRISCVSNDDSENRHVRPTSTAS